MFRTVTTRTAGALIVTVALIFWPSAGSAASLEPALDVAVRGLALQFADGFATYEGGIANSAPDGSPFQGQVAVLFTLASPGGGNGGQQYLAVYSKLGDGTLGSRPKPYQLVAVVRVGSRRSRWFTAIQFDGNRIVLRGRRWLDTDASCCPTARTSATYRLNEGGFAE